MDNEARGHHAVDALRRLGELCKETIVEQGGDRSSAWALVRARLDELPAEDRAQIDAALRQILDFQAPSSRSSQ